VDYMTVATHYVAAASLITRDNTATDCTDAGFTPPNNTIIKFRIWWVGQDTAGHSLQALVNGQAVSGVGAVATVGSLSSMASQIDAAINTSGIGYHVTGTTIVPTVTGITGLEMYWQVIAEYWVQ
jgi:hypothetical protein